jgi:hypothetical protein
MREFFESSKVEVFLFNFFKLYPYDILNQVIMLNEMVK